MSFGAGRSRSSGYLARSVRSGPGVLVLHDWFGLGPAVRSFCDSLCGSGFTALAPDYYDGRRAASVEEAEALKDSLDPPEVDRVLGTAAGYLRDNWHPRLGIVGFSLGAFYALRAAAGSAEAIVLYYGTGDPAGATGAPLLGHFAERDDLEPLDEVREWFATVEGSGGDVELVVHRGAGHWFASEDTPEAFDPNAASVALATTVDFLGHHLA